MVQTVWVRRAEAFVASLLAGFVALTRNVLAAEPVDPAYIKSLAAPGKTVLVVEYYDGSNAVVSRKGYASAAGFRASSPNDIGVDARTTLHLYGLEPCKGEMVNRKEGFSGSCRAFAQKQLEIVVKSPKVILCRAFLSEQNAARQDVTCFGYYNFPGSLDSIENFEAHLLSLGALRLAKTPDGSLMRPDLEAAEKIGRQGFGMWADPRTKQ